MRQKFKCPNCGTKFKVDIPEGVPMVMCPTCGTTLELSNAPAANQIREFVRVRIAAGDTKSEIEDKLVAEFGRGVLASPPKEGFDLLAWVLPLLALAVGAGVIGFLVVRWSRDRTETGLGGGWRRRPRGGGRR